MQVEVKQVDREAAASNILTRLKFQHGGEQPWMDASTASMRMGEQDDHWEVQAFASHRQAAERRGAEAAIEAAARHFRDAVARGYSTPAEKRDQCEHGKFGWEDCIACYDDALEAAIRAIDPAAVVRKES